MPLQEIIDWLGQKDEELSAQLPLRGDVLLVQQEKETHAVRSPAPRCPSSSPAQPLPGAQIADPAGSTTEAAAGGAGEGTPTPTPTPTSCEWALGHPAAPLLVPPALQKCFSVNSSLRFQRGLGTFLWQRFPDVTVWVCGSFGHWMSKPWQPSAKGQQDVILQPSLPSPLCALLSSPGFHGRSEVPGAVYLLCPGVSTGFPFPASV